jgi:uncharacterized membrane protein
MGISTIGSSTLGMVLMMGPVWIGLALLLIWCVRRLFPVDRRSAEEVAREVLGRRYAAGEITEAEYLRALDTLRYD